MISSVGRLQQPLIVVPHLDVVATQAVFGLSFGVLVCAGDHAERD